MLSMSGNRKSYKNYKNILILFAAVEIMCVNVAACRALKKIIYTVITLFVIWRLLYMPMKPESHILPETFTLYQTLPLQENLTWILSQGELNKYILPDKDTSIVLPKSQCNGSIFLVVVVCSAILNFDARQAIRSTWAQDAIKLRSVQVFFLMGKSRNQTLNSAVVDESSKYGDIIQQDFIDTYNNLTLKSVMLLKWTNQNCTNAKYVMKTDDDMFVNLPNLFRLLKAKGHKDLLLGCLIKGAVPVKDWNSKWFVPDVIFPGSVYPPYLSGTGYVMSQNAASLLYRTALSTPFFYIEDIFITGICGSRVGLKPVNNDGFKFYKRKNDICVFRSLITAHKMTTKELIQVWKNISNPSIKCKS